MKKVTLLCGMLLALTAGVAAAAPGVNLRWANCFGDAGTINRNFACNTNTGNHILVGSFELGQNILQASGNEVVIDLAAADATLPAWWGFKNAGTCRQASQSMNFVIPGTAVVCADWANGQAAGGIGAYNIGERGPNTARVKAAIAVPASALADLFAGQEYFSYNLVMNSANTVGTGSCAGCEVPVCIVFNSLKVTTQIAANDRTISGPTNGSDSNFATWQGGGVPVTPGGTGCGAATPTKNATWGAVKSLYRN
jgi:hypothetical protein